MSFVCTYANVPFCLNTLPSDTWVEATIALDDMRVLTEPRLTGANLTGLTLPLRQFSRPRLRLGNFFYPTGASRWAEFHGLMTDDQLKVVRPLAYQATGAVAQGFLLKQDTQQISTNLFMLPPRPLAKFGSLNGLYLVSLVDERYYWQWSSSGRLTVNTGTTWLSLLETLASALNISLNADPIPPAYGQPNPDSELNAYYENAALMLDAVAANVGMVIVRSLLGIYSAMTAATTNKTITANIPSPRARLAGGDCLA